MTKFEAGLRYEMGKMLKALGLFVAGIAVLMAAIRLTALAFGFCFVYFNGTYSFALVFLVVWLLAVFERDAALLAQSGLARRQAFSVLALTIAAAALVFALADGALSLAVPGFWSDHSLVLGASDGYTAALFGHVLLLNMAVAFFAFAVAAVQRRVGTGWTVALMVCLFTMVFVGLPSVFSLFPGGAEALSAYMLSLTGSPHAPEWGRAVPAATFAAVAVAAAAVAWALMRRFEVR